MNVLSKADWIYDEEMDMHIPCCTRTYFDEEFQERQKCGNGPLTGEQITRGDCGEHGV